jgi:hypothetical protein
MRAVSSEVASSSTRPLLQIRGDKCQEITPWATNRSRRPGFALRERSLHGVEFTCFSVKERLELLAVQMPVGIQVM